MKKVVVYAGTRNLYKHMVVAVTSLLCNNPSIDVVYFLIEDDVFPYDLPCKVRTMNVSGQEYFKETEWAFLSRFTYMTLMRNILSKLLPEEEKVLWLDVDTIVDDDITDLFELNMDGYCYAGVHEPTKCVDVFRYINAGVMLANLALIRELKKDDEMIWFLNRYELEWPDQEVINILCQGRIRLIGSEYNKNDFVEKCTRPRIVHYAGKRYWANERLYKKYEAIAEVEK